MKTESSINLKVYISSKEATAKLNRAARAAERLQRALEALKGVEVEVHVTEQPKHWYQFWK